MEMISSIAIFHCFDSKSLSIKMRNQVDKWQISRKSVLKLEGTR